MKTYKFIYLDKNGNELQTETRTDTSIQSARKLANLLLANSMINDLRKIKVMLQK